MMSSVCHVIGFLSYQCQVLFQIGKSEIDLKTRSQNYNTNFSVRSKDFQFLSNFIEQPVHRFSNSRQLLMPNSCLKFHLNLDHPGPKVFRSIKWPDTIGNYSTPTGRGMTCGGECEREREKEKEREWEIEGKREENRCKNKCSEREKEARQLTCKYVFRDRQK